MGPNSPKRALLTDIDDHRSREVALGGHRITSPAIAGGTTDR